MVLTKFVRIKDGQHEQNVSTRKSGEIHMKISHMNLWACVHYIGKAKIDMCTELVGKYFRTSKHITCVVFYSKCTFDYILDSTTPPMKEM